MVFSEVYSSDDLSLKTCRGSGEVEGKERVSGQ